MVFSYSFIPSKQQAIFLLSCNTWAATQYPQVSAAVNRWGIPLCFFLQPAVPLFDQDTQHLFLKLAMLLASSDGPAERMIMLASKKVKSQSPFVPMVALPRIEYPFLLSREKRVCSTPLCTGSVRFKGMRKLGEQQLHSLKYRCDCFFSFYVYQSM